MSVINQHTDQSVTFTNESIPANSKVVSTVKRTLSGDSVLLSLQVQAGSYHVSVTFTPYAAMSLPRVHIGYSWTRDEIGTTTNTVISDQVKAHEPMSPVTHSVQFKTDGLGPITLGLRGGQSNSIYSCELRIFRV